MTKTPNKTGTVLALDIGEKRIGVALASLAARLPEPLTTLTNDAVVLEKIAELADRHQTDMIVAGLPRSLEGTETAQTRSVREFVGRLEDRLGRSVYLMDEAGTSAEAEAGLRARRKPYTKADIDARAAAIILQDFLNSLSKL